MEENNSNFMDRDPSNRNFVEVNVEEPSYHLDYVNQSDLESQWGDQQQMDLRHQIQMQMEIELKSMLQAHMEQLNIKSLDELEDRVGLQNKEKLINELQEQLINRIQYQMHLQSINTMESTSKNHRKISMQDLI